MIQKKKSIDETRDLLPPEKDHHRKAFELPLYTGVSALHVLYGDLSVREAEVEGSGRRY